MNLLLFTYHILNLVKFQCLSLYMKNYSIILNTIFVVIFLRCFTLR